ncbi:PD-(D/E)XK nuclease-like domain-containing protein [Photobacterium toruni]|uniref:Exodeoxyribonuclease 8 n=1 Tax=Photobacterium toruni TaxID=1935446 RepID=A0A1T4USH8_9GAMM|nr:PD-(D/E)XK nuclease-like domain-containing protein [Photobacterium toruni]SKA55614.1 Exodeoxyribonuclease 8 [Photobacterium toruni]
MSLMEAMSASEVITNFKFPGMICEVKRAYDKYNKPTYKDDNGELIEGIYIDLENEVYHSLPAYSSSQIKTLVTKTPAHFYRQYLSGIDRKRTTKQTQNTLDAGTYGHELILEPHGFYDRYFRGITASDYPDALSLSVAGYREMCADRGITIPKTAKKERCIEALKQAEPQLEFLDDLITQHNNNTSHTGKKEIDPIVWDDAHRVLESQQENEIANALVKNGLPEISFITKCPITGMWLKCRFDWLRFDNIAVDVKTTRSTNPIEFAKQSGNLGYHIQEAFYTYVASILGVKITNFIFLTVEYVECDWCEVYELDDGEDAMQKMIDGLNLLKHCKETNSWRGYSHTDTIRKIKIPNYLL